MSRQRCCLSCQGVKVLLPDTFVSVVVVVVVVVVVLFRMCVVVGWLLAIVFLPFLCSGGGAYSCVACPSILNIDHASLARRSKGVSLSFLLFLENNSNASGR